MKNNIWILGASDPEMEMIESLLTSRDEHVAYATLNGERVRPAQAAHSECADPALERIRAYGGCIYLVEVDMEDPRYGTRFSVWIDCAAIVVRVDHHAPGDPGYGVPPARYLEGSSIGQVCRYLDIGITDEIRLCAAADHCLAAAYRGLCPGVDPDALMGWRVRQQAVYRGVSEEQVYAEIDVACAALLSAPMITLESVADMCHTYDHDWATSVCDGCNHDPISIRDMRAAGKVVGLPEASAYLGECFLAVGLPDGSGRTKVVCQSGTPEQIRAFIHWAERQGYTGIYGDPARGFAGGYLAYARVL